MKVLGSGEKEASAYGYLLPRLVAATYQTLSDHPPNFKRPPTNPEGTSFQF